VVLLLVEEMEVFHSLFAHKLKSSKIRTSERKKVLSELYYYLGSRYVASRQPERALNSFQKSFDLERSSYNALYGIAYCYIEIEPMIVCAINVISFIPSYI
jgi:tetratricopeptide (TPR) repeat protein